MSSSKKCKCCGEKIDNSRNIYCSKSCAATVNNQGVRRNYKKRVCSFCKNEYTGRGKKFCSQRCCQGQKYKDFVNRWLDGDENGQSGDKTSAYIRRYLFEMHNASCQKCGWSKVNESTGKIPLSVHHIDGDWRNNKIENLELLCPCCHSLTPNYGSKNIGNGRQERYA